MKAYSKYDLTTGKIVCSGLCQNEVFLQANDMVSGQYDDTKYYIDRGFVVPFPEKTSYLHEWDWSTHTWILPSTALDTIKVAKSTEISEVCSTAIVSGFISSALGQPHCYPSKMTDQANLNASVTASLYPELPSTWTTPFWCVSMTNEWDYRYHTAAQIQQVGVDGKNTILGYMDKNAMLQLTISAATTIEDVESIVW